MARYIDAGEFFQTLGFYEQSFDENRDFSARQTILQIMHELEHAPTADVVEVKHGEWIEIKAEIERLQKAIKVQDIMIEQQDYKIKSKSEVIKEFAERLKKELRMCTGNNGGFIPGIIDNLVKEMLGEPSKIEHDSLCETETYKTRKG